VSGSYHGAIIAQHFRSLGAGVWAIADQGLFAASNLALGMLLARWLPSREYGGFAVAYASFLLLGTVHTALLSEPMLVFGAGKYRARFPEYLQLLLRGQWLVAAAGSVLLAVAGLLLWQSADHLGRGFLALAAAAPLILANWLLRRACYVRGQTQWAAAAGGLHLGTTLLGMYALFRADALSVPAAFAVMAVASGFAGLWLGSRLRLLPAHVSDGVPLSRVAAEHWSYGRWAAASGVLYWIPLEVYYLVVPAWNGLTASAALKALVTLMMPVQQAQWAVATILIPVMVRRRDQPSFDRLLRVAGGGIAAASVSYWLVLGAFHRPIVHWLFGGRYDQFSALLWLLGIVPLLDGTAQLLMSALRALERPDLIFRATLVLGATTIVPGIPAVAIWGIEGAAVARALSFLVVAATMWVLLARLRRPAHAAAQPRVPTLDVESTRSDRHPDSPAYRLGAEVSDGGAGEAPGVQPAVSVDETRNDVQYEQHGPQGRAAHPGETSL